MGKRKLNADLVPEEHAQSPSANDASNIEAASPSKAATTAAAAATAAQKTAPPSSWEDIAIEPRLKRAVKTLQWSSPTLVQASAIPHILEGRDLLIRSGTGSGKSAAFMLPLLTKTLQQKRQTLILAPTKELASQLTKVAKSLTAYATEIRVRNIAGQESDAVTKAALADRPEIVVATPARAWANIAALTSASAVVVDEAVGLVAHQSM
jgi:ATP-dependent RNA helicase DDX56/DBP9